MPAVVTPTTLEPEREVHSDGSTTNVFSKYSSSTREAVLKLLKDQSEETVRLRPPASTNRSLSCGDSDSEDIGIPCIGLELGSGYSWSDDDDAKTPTEAGSAFSDSIAAIRKEASKVTAAMAADQLDTFKQDIGTLKKELTSRASELNELKALLRVKDDRIATLQLERDLYKADASNSRDDVLRGLGSVSSSDQSENAHPHNEIRAPRAPVADRRAQSTPGPHSSPNVDKTQAWSKPASRGSDAVPPEQSRMSHIDAKSRDAMFAFEDSICSDSWDLEPQRTTGPTTRRCGHFRRLPADRPQKENRKVASLQAQAERLQHQLQESNETCDELRKRIALVTSYFDNLVRQQQDTIAALKTERLRIEIDVAGQIAAVQEAKRRDLSRLECKLRLKDKEIARLHEF